MEKKGEGAKGRSFEVRFPDNLIAPTRRYLFSSLKSYCLFVASLSTRFLFSIAIDAPRDRPADRPETVVRPGDRRGITIDS